jgi:hypothetical protein
MEIVKPTAVLLSLAMIGFEQAHIETRQFQAEPLPARPFVLTFTFSGTSSGMLPSSSVDWMNYR